MIRLRDILFFVSENAFLNITCEDQQHWYNGYITDDDIKDASAKYNERPVIMFEMNELGFNIMIGGNTI